MLKVFRGNIKIIHSYDENENIVAARTIPGRFNVIVGGLVVVFVLTLGAALLAWDGYRNQQRQAEQDIINESTILAAHARQSFNAVNELLQSVSEQIRLANVVDEAGFRKLASSREVFDSLKTMVSGVQQVRLVALIGSDGALEAGTAAFPVSSANVADRDYFREAMKPGFHEVTLGKPVPNRVNGELTLFFARQITAPDGTALGVVSAGVGISFFEAFYDEINLDEDSSICLLRIDGQLLASSPHQPDTAALSYADRPTFRDGVFAGRRAGLIELNDAEVLEGTNSSVPRITAYRVVEGLPLVVSMTRTRNSYLSHWRRQTISIAAVTALMVALIIGLSLVLQRLLVRLHRSDSVLREQRRLLDVTLEAMEQGIMLITPDRKVPICNRQARALLDLPERVDDVPEDFDAIRALQHTQGEFSNAPAKEEFSLSHLRPLDKKFEYERTRPNGTILRVTQLPLEDGGAVRTYTDLTHQRQVESQLLQAQRLDALGQMTAGIAHDFNNLLGVIVTNLDMVSELSEGYEGGHMPQEDIALNLELLVRAQGAALTAADLVRGLMAFSRQKMLEIEPMESRPLLRRCQVMLRQALSDRMDVEASFQHDVWPVLVDGSQIEMAVLNLGLNARDASPVGSVLRLTAENRSVSAGNCPEGLLPGDYVVISVIDKGSGMDKATLARVFEPFFSTKGPGAGSGLGLSMVFGTMRQLGSVVDIQSEPGHGTTVSLYLPRSRVIPPAELRPPARRATQARRRVLLVEDNSDLRETTTSLLELLGHEVVAVGDAKSALSLWATDHNFDLVFSDVVMPGPMNGVQLVRKLRQQSPGIKVLLTSGFADGAYGGSIEDARDMAGLPMLNKPYRKDELAACLQNIFATA